MSAPAPVKPAKLTSGDLCQRLRTKYPAEAYAMLYEVRNGTGFTRSPRSADVLVMSLWPSRGLELIGFEVKVDRADWKRELADPGKADAIQRYCDRWYVVTSAENVAPIEEVPPTWGLLVAHGTGLRCHREAPKLDAKAIDRLFLASLLRNAAAAQASHPVMEKEIERRVEAGVRDHEWERKRIADDLARLQERLKEFEQVSGVKIDGWGLGNVAAAVKLLGDGGLQQAVRNLQALGERAGGLHKHINEMLAAVGAKAGA